MIINRLKTAVLLGLLSGFLLLLGSLSGGNWGMGIAFFLALVSNFFIYFYSDQFVLRMYNARKLDERDYYWIYGLVRDLSLTMKLPMPKLWIIRFGAPNAFATGRNPENGSIVISKEIIDLLTQDELQGVLAHELAHIKNRDILVSTIAATLAAAIGYLAQMGQHMLFWGNFRGNTDRNRESFPQKIALVVSLVLMPLAALLVQMGISRSREYLADETGAYASREPLALASALEKIELYKNDTSFDDHRAHQAFSSLFIISPLCGQSIASLFSTHPSTKDRVVCLKKIAENIQKQKGKHYEW